MKWIMGFLPDVGVIPLCFIYAAACYICGALTGLFCQCGVRVNITAALLIKMFPQLLPDLICCFHNLAGMVTTTPQTGVRRCRHCSADPRPRTSCCILVVDSSQPICAGSYIAISRYLCEHLHCSALMGGRQDQSQRSCGPPPDPSPPPGAPSETMEETVQDRQWYPQLGAVRSYTIPPRLARTPPAVDGVGGAPQSPQDQPTPRWCPVLDSCT